MQPARSSPTPRTTRRREPRAGRGRRGAPALEAGASRGVDATCPFVTKGQKLAERAAAEGRDVVVVGNPDHPEMIGVVGYAPNNSHVVRDAAEVANLPALLRAPLVVSQTT